MFGWFAEEFLLRFLETSAGETPSSVKTRMTLLRIYGCVQGDSWAMLIAINEGFYVEIAKDEHSSWITGHIFGQIQNRANLLTKSSLPIRAKFHWRLRFQL